MPPFCSAMAPMKDCRCLNKSPCLTASRSAAGGHWVVSRGRRFTFEMAKLMGVAPRRLKAWDSSCLTAAQRGHILGNAVPVSLLRRVLEGALPAVGLL